MFDFSPSVCVGRKLPILYTMATAEEPQTAPDKELEEIIKLIWGQQVRQDIFQRWTQGKPPS